MKRIPLFIRVSATAALLMGVLLAGCESDGSGGSSSVDVHGSFYYGTGYGYPGYGGFYGPGYYPPPVVVVPPPIHGHPGGGVRPTPMPSMPAARPRGR